MFQERFQWARLPPNIIDQEFYGFRDTQAIIYISCGWAGLGSLGNTVMDLKVDHYAAFRSVPYENGGLVASWERISTSSYVGSWRMIAWSSLLDLDLTRVSGFDNRNIEYS